MGWRSGSISRFALPFLAVFCVACGDAHPGQRAYAQTTGPLSDPAIPSKDSQPAAHLHGAVHASDAAKSFNSGHVFDLAGRSFNPLGNAGDKAVVLIFVCTDCPVANRYAPDLERLYEAYRAKRVAFYLVYADPREGPKKIRRHLQDFGYKIAALRDPQHQLVQLCKATKTPEAVLFLPDRTQVYRGRIDDRFTDYGKARSAPSREDLREAIDCVLQGRPVPARTTEVVGCLIPEIRK